MSEPGWLCSDDTNQSTERARTTKLANIVEISTHNAAREQDANKIKINWKTHLPASRFDAVASEPGKGTRFHRPNVYIYVYLTLN